MDKIMQSANPVGMSLSKATQPFLTASRLVGMNPKSHWHKIYTVFILVCEISTLSYVWQYYIICLDKKNYYFNILVHALGDVCRIISLVVILGPSLFDQKRYIVLLKDLANIDGSFKTLSRTIDNRGIYRVQILLLSYVGLTVLLFGVVKINFALLPEKDDQMYRITLWGCSYYLAVIVICAVKDCSFTLTLSIIRRRYQEINVIIDRGEKHGLDLRGNVLEVSRARTENEVLIRLKILRKQYHNLWRITNRVNKSYGPHLLVGSTTSLALITSHLWQSYTTFTTSSYRMTSQNITVEGIIWALFYVARMFLLVIASESTVAEAKGASAVLQELEMAGNHDFETRSEIRDFLTQIQLEVPKFTACGFFDVDFTLICCILGAACTYLVILIQIGDSNDCVTTDHCNQSIST